MNFFIFYYFLKQCFVNLERDDGQSITFHAIACYEYYWNFVLTRERERERERERCGIFPIAVLLKRLKNTD